MSHPQGARPSYLDNPPLPPAVPERMERFHPNESPPTLEELLATVARLEREREQRERGR